MSVRSRPGGRHRGHPHAGRPGGRRGTAGGPASRRDARPRRRARRLRRSRQCGGRAETHARSPEAVVGLPGAVDYESGRLLWAPNLPERWPDLLSRDAARRPDSAFRSASPTMPTWPRWAKPGSAPAQVVADMGYLTVSTGIGAGIVERGRLPPRRALAGRAGPHRHRLAGLGARDAGHPRGVGFGQRPGPAGPRTAVWAISTPAAWRTRPRAGTRRRRPSGRGRSSPGRSPSSTW